MISRITCLMSVSFSFAKTWGGKFQILSEILYILMIHCALLISFFKATVELTSRKLRRKFFKELRENKAQCTVNDLKTLHGLLIWYRSS